MKVVATGVTILTAMFVEGTLVVSHAQAPARTLVAVWAHADDEVPVGPLLARYARDGVNVYMIIVTDGSQGGGNTSIPRGPALARARAEEARCATDALGVHPPILLGFPDGALGSYTADPALLYRLTEQLQKALQPLRADALVTWGPDGGTGHPDHRLVSSLVTQPVRAGAPGAPERLFYTSIPADGFRAMNPARGAPPFLVPQQTYFRTRVTFSDGDAAAAQRSMACHTTQYGDDVVRRVAAAMREAWKGELPLIPAFAPPPSNDLFP